LSIKAASSTGEIVEDRRSVELTYSDSDRDNFLVKRLILDVDASLILTIKSGLCRLNFDQVISRILPNFGSGANWSDYHGYVRKNTPDVFSGTSDNQ
jgi:hypothetical protein